MKGSSLPYLVACTLVFCHATIRVKEPRLRSMRYEPCAQGKHAHIACSRANQKDLLHWQLRNRYLSEIADGGLVGWSKYPVTNKGVNIGFPTPQAPVNFNGLFGTQKISTLNFQGWAMANFSVSEPGGVVYINCAPTHTFSIDSLDGVLHGNIYHTQHGWVSVKLGAGSHTIRTRVRAKGQVSFQCRFRSDPEDLRRTVAGAEGYPQPDRRGGNVVAAASSAVLFDALPSCGPPDLLEGFTPWQHLSIPLLNADPAAWISRAKLRLRGVRVHARGVTARLAPPPGEAGPAGDRETSVGVEEEKGGVVEVEVRGSEALDFGVAPGAVLPLTLLFRVSTIGESEWWGDLVNSDDPCVTLLVSADVERRGEARSTTKVVRVGLRCRRRGQSYVFSLLDHDGSVSHAATITPLGNSTCNAGGAVPILLSMSGVGVGARQQADAHKYVPVDGQGGGNANKRRKKKKRKGSKKQKRSGDFVFGVHGAWTLAPYRQGAHNWEGTGRWSALAAVDALASQVSPFVVSRGFAPCAGDGSRLIVAGHSRGGHGAWEVGSHYPDRVLGILSASGWHSRELYADANTLFHMDAQLAFAEPQLLSVMRGTLIEHSSALHAGNFAGYVPILTRVGQQDRSVPPLHNRIMARVVSEYASEKSTPQGPKGGMNLFSEIAGKGHWWWNTLSTNDGGALHDDEVRRFFKWALKQNAGGEGDGHVVPLPPSNALTRFVARSNADSKKVGWWLPAWDLTMSIASHNPGSVHSKAGVRVILLSRWAQRGEASIHLEKLRGATNVFVRIVTANVERLSVSTPQFILKNLKHAGGRMVPVCITLLIDGVRFCVTSPFNTCICSAKDTSARAAHFRSLDDPLCFERESEASLPLWRKCGHPSDALDPDSVDVLVEEEIDGTSNTCAHEASRSTTQEGSVTNRLYRTRGFGSFGPARMLFSRPFIIVAGTASRLRDVEKVSEWRGALLEVANYLSAGHLHAQDTRAPVVLDINLAESVARKHNLLLVGGPLLNTWAAKLAPFSPLRYGWDTAGGGVRSILFGFRGSACRFGPGHGVVHTLPWVGRDGRGAPQRRLALTVDGSTIRALRDISRFSFAANQPLSRAPFTNMAPDFLVASPDLRWKGLGGVVAAGSWDAWWRVASEASYLSCRPTTEWEEDLELFESSSSCSSPPAEHDSS